MEFKEGTKVYTATGDDVGEIARVVLNPETNEITHIVVSQGWLFTEDRVLPIHLVDQAVADRIQLRADVKNLDDLPNFEESYYVEPDGTSHDPQGYAPQLYWYPPMGNAWSGYYSGSYGYTATPYVLHTEQNIPEGTVGLREGARVVSADGEDVGTVERIFTNNKMNRATHLLVKEGWLFQEKHSIPVDWIRSVDENEIRLSVNANTLDRVPAYNS